MQTMNYSHIVCELRHTGLLCFCPTYNAIGLSKPRHTNGWRAFLNYNGHLAHVHYQILFSMLYQ